MKRLLLAVTLAAASLSAFAAGPADLETVRAYTLKTLQKCPDSKLDLKPVNNGGPAGFLMYDATMTSSDTSCGRHVYVLISPVTQQTVVGTVFQLDRNGAGNVETRVSALATEMLQSRIRAVIAGFPLPDGLRSVSMNKETPQGTFAYHGFVDSSGSYLIVGTRGNLKVDPARSLMDALNVEAEGVHRGNKMAKAQIIELSDFQCPTCGRAHKKVEPIIEKNLSKVNYTRLDLPLFEHHEWSLDAAMGARAIRKVAPKSYWDYVNFVFGNQETIGKTEFTTVLKDFCSDHDIDYKKIEPLYKSPKERASLLDQVSRAFDNGINSTPTYIVNGQIMGFGPEGTFTIDAIKKALGVK